MASTSITRALEVADKFKVRVMRGRELAKLETERMYGAAAGVVGGVVSGALDAKYRDPDGSTKKFGGHVPAIGVINLAVTVLGLSGYIPMYVGQLGLGGLSYNLGKWMFDKEVVRQTTATTPPATGT
jgi:hypothetical protein